MDKVAEALIDAGAAKPRNEVAASLTAYNPSVRERIGNSIYDIARYLSMDSIANRLRNDVETGIDFVPFVGDAIGLDDARNDFNAGNYGMAAAGLGLSAAGIVPGVGDAVAAGGRKILSSRAENARVLADMLASGRANEVTNDMISAADPSELWKLYESGATGVPMPMDQASRMARAREMGFDTGTPLYHGTASDIHSFIPSADGKFGGGVYTSPEPSMAEKYMNYKEGDYSVIPVFNRGDRLNLDGAFSAEQKDRLKLPKRVSMPDDLWPSNVTAEQYYKDIDKRAVRGGYSSREYGSPYSEVVTFDPTNIRSQFARFDPRLKHLSHLSAGLAGAVAAGTISLEVANQMQELGQDYQP